jgi:hypothetical protein
MWGLSNEDFQIAFTVLREEIGGSSLDLEADNKFFLEGEDLLHFEMDRIRVFSLPNLCIEERARIGLYNIMCKNVISNLLD